MKKITHTYSNPKQAVLPILIQDYLDICDPVLTFDRFMGEIDLEKYLKEIPKHEVGRLRYNPVSMLKTIPASRVSNVEIMYNAPAKYMSLFVSWKTAAK